MKVFEELTLFLQCRQSVSYISLRLARRLSIHVWSSIFWQFLCYCLVGGVKTLADILIFNALLWHFPTNNASLLVVYNSVALAAAQ